MLLGCAPLGLYPPATADAPEVVEVSLTDTSVTLRPALVGKGKIALDLVNEGDLEHGLSVVGPGVDESSDEFLVPAQRRRMWVKLGPGRFRVFCPDGDHAARGVSAELVVSDAPVGFFRR
jgi:hypothetical protein